MSKDDKAQEKPEVSNGTSNEPNDQEKKIIRQVEYYFGDFNLPRDKFLQEQVKLDDGWISMDVMVKFQRLAQLSVDFDVITGALKKSSSGMMEVSEDGKKIRRSPDKPVMEFTKERKEELMSRTVYAKGFPLEGSVLDDLLEFFKQFGELENLQMRTYHDKAKKTAHFKGSVFAVFSTRELAEDFMKKESVKFEEVELIRKWQEDYLEEKKKEHEGKRKSKDKKSQKKQKQNQSGKLQAKGKKNEDESGEAVEDADAEKGEEEEKESLPKGAVLHMSGCPPNLTREDIKSKLGDMDAVVAYVDFKKGDEKGWIRMQNAENATKVITNIGESGKLEICGAELVLRLLEGEEEETFLTRVKEDIEKMKKNKANRGRRGGRGGYSSHRGRKRKGGPYGGPSAKRVATR